MGMTTVSWRHLVAPLLLLLTSQAIPTQAQQKQPQQAKSRGLVVVAPKAFHPALAEYIRERTKQRSTTLVALEEVLTKEKGVDDPEKLKRYLFRLWKENGVQYALLVGDADVLPVRYMVLDRVTPTAYDYAFYPSDLYYSDLAKQDGSFDDWNARKDGFHAGYFGEVRGEKNKGDGINYDAVDYRPDIAVGRWPVSNPTEVATVAAKTLAYERGLSGRTKAGTGGAAIFAVGGWVDMRSNMDDCVSSLKQGWQVSRFYYADKDRNDRTPPPDNANLIGLMNSGVSLLLHAGHGHDNGWAECFNISDLKGIHNADRLPVVVSAGCSTARFATLPPYEAYVDVNGQEHKGTDAGEVFTAPPPPPACYQKGRFNPSGLGERLLRGGPDGAVAYIGCNTGSQPCGLTLLQGFTTAASGAQPRLGDCWSAAVTHYYDAEHLATITPTPDWYPASIFFQGMKFMVYGDPTLPLR